MKIKFNCINCGNEDFYQSSQDKFYKGNGKFCSKKCRNIFYSKYPEKHPSFKNGSIDSSGYISISLAGKRNRQHRIIMERHLGRKLLKNEHVHHKNGIKHDNRIENLEVINESEHHKEHWKDPEFIKKMSFVRSENSKNIINKWEKFVAKNWSIKYRKCVNCGTDKAKYQGKGLCSKCYLKDYQRNVRLKELKAEILSGEDEVKRA